MACGRPAAGRGQHGERILVAVLAFVLWLAPILALGHAITHDPVPGSDICRAQSAGSADEHPATGGGHRCQDCCCSAVRLGGGPPASTGWFFLPASAPVLAGDVSSVPRPLVWRDLAPPPRAPPSPAADSAVAPGIG
ncbi:DUF2946 family protein [Azoarcus sp. DN11]|uniref:DUF2946 family protein n=1 Tax=Azoarcus sp. DN11 TaxID=356837 RepID=UPI000EB4A496|nr:DUF2946 family protein [Azoarcus sp. DN11]AYH41973.1 hypothetical protein CDA09_01005 [Azoarcus sp. DN11]